jgi:biopolymer transport protein ExbD
MSQSILEQTSFSSTIAETSTLDPKSNKGLKSFVQPLMLTSLVDAFSILVLYLLISFSSSGEILYISKDMVLPPSTESEVLDRQIIIKFQQGKYYIENEEVSKANLFPMLLKMKVDFKAKYPELDSENKIIIQADKNEKFLDLNLIIHASAQAGFEEIKFAVIKNS